MHWATDECPAKKSANRPVVDRTPRDGVGLIPSDKPEGLVGPAYDRDGDTANTKPTHYPSDRHPPCYMASYMRQWRAKQKADKMALTPNVNTTTGR
jgi:hypothetical protein